MLEPKVAAEVAELEFQKFVDGMDLDTDPTGLDADDVKSFESAKRKLIGAICKGHLSVDEKGQPVYVTQGDPNGKGAGVTITFHEQTGASLMAMDQKKKGQEVAKMYAVMADMTQTTAQTFAEMAGRDLKVCQAITALFLA
jgi:hypothetical protein